MEEGQCVDSRRKKKLIAAILMGYDPWVKVFSCKGCREKHSRGCTKNRRAVVLVPCICNGQRGCDVCHGSGTITYKRCPSAYTKESWIYELLPYYYRYKVTNEYPDKQGRIYQPVKLLEALELMGHVATRKEIDQLEKANATK